MIYRIIRDIYNKLIIMESKVLTQEEIQSLKNIQENQLSLAEQLGFLEYKILILEKEKQKLKQVFQNQTETEEQLVKQLQEKYGDGNINLEKGEFTPVP